MFLMREACSRYSHLPVNLLIPSPSDFRWNSLRPIGASADWGAPMLLGGERVPPRTRRGTWLVRQSLPPGTECPGPGPGSASALVFAEQSCDSDRALLGSCVARELTLRHEINLRGCPLGGLTAAAGASAHCPLDGPGGAQTPTLRPALPAQHFRFLPASLSCCDESEGQRCPGRHLW